MNPLPVHTLDSAPATARPPLEALKKGLGFIPNLYAVMAGSPAVLESALALSKAFDVTSLTASERQVVLMTTSALNECTYCMAAHSVIAGMQKVAPAVVTALRDGTPLPEVRLEALRTFTRAVIKKRGFAGGDELAALLRAGFTPPQALEVLLGIAQKTLTNYVNHLAHTPLDAAFQPRAWEPVGASR